MTNNKIVMIPNRHRMSHNKNITFFNKSLNVSGDELLNTVKNTYLWRRHNIMKWSFTHFKLMRPHHEPLMQ